MHRTLAALSVIASATLAAGCAKDAPPPQPEADPVVVLAPAPAPVAPETEEALVQALSDAFASRDLARVGALAAPELAADLRRMHGADPDAFWGRSQGWIDNVASGFKVGAKQEDRADRWRVLVQFGNGEEETLVVTRVDGRLVFFSL